MAFKFQDMAFSLSTGEDDRSWMLVIGCGPQSLADHGDTQQPFVRNQPVDQVYGLRHVNDVKALKQELIRLFESLTALEQQVAAQGQPPGGSGPGGGNT